MTPPEQSTGCSAVRGSIASGIRFTPVLLDHIAGCQGCGELTAQPRCLGAGLASLAHTGISPVSPQLLAEVSASMAADRGILGKLRHRSVTTRLALMLLLMAGVTTFILLQSPRADLAVYPLFRFVAIAAGLAGLYGLMLTHSFRGLHRRQLSSRAIYGLAGLAALLPLIMALSPYAHEAHPASLLGTGADLVPRALACFCYGMVLGLPALLGSLLLSRHHHGMQGATVLAAAAAGLLGNLALHSHCPLVSPVHQLLGHVPVVVLVVLTYAGLRRRL